LDFQAQSPAIDWDSALETGPGHWIWYIAMHENFWGRVRKAYPMYDALITKQTWSATSHLYHAAKREQVYPFLFYGSVLPLTNRLF